MIRAKYLAAAYALLSSGDLVANLNKAIASLEAALRVHTEA